MAWLIGVDEAGYGPNLGPLAVAATAWHVDEYETTEKCDQSRLDTPTGTQRTGPNINSLRQQNCTNNASNLSHSSIMPADSTAVGRSGDLYELLSGIVVNPANQQVDSCKIAIGDSKRLHKPSGGLKLLERAVLASIGCADSAWNQTPATWQRLLDATGADPDGQRHNIPWYTNFDCTLPTDATSDDIALLTDSLQENCATAGIRIGAIRARLMFPAEFNLLLDQLGSKGAVLSHTTLGLVRRVIDESVCFNSTAAFDDRNAHLAHMQSDKMIGMTLDKHGGRNRYAALIQHCFPECWIDVLGEEQSESRYRWKYKGYIVQACFRTSGEAELPVGLASMTAKYLRELAMSAFNQFWSSHAPGVRPTAGYPVDAQRFKSDITDAQTRLGVKDVELWRNR